MSKPAKERWRMVCKDLEGEADGLEEVFEQWAIDDDPGIRAIGCFAWGLSAAFGRMRRAIEEGIGDRKRPEEEL